MSHRQHEIPADPPASGSAAPAAIVFREVPGARGQLDRAVPQPARTALAAAVLRLFRAPVMAGQLQKRAYQITRVKQHVTGLADVLLPEIWAPVRYLAMYQAARAGLQICMSRTHKRKDTCGRIWPQASRD